jgi:hypothetical protein
MNRQERRASLAFVRRTAHEWHPFKRRPEVEHHFARFGDIAGCYLNNIYAVQAYARGDQGAVHLAIRRHDGAEVHGWSDLQRIKSELIGPTRVAIEIYPPDAELVDDANMRHLFVLPWGEAAPFTIQGRWS